MAPFFVCLVLSSGTPLHDATFALCTQHNAIQHVYFINTTQHVVLRVRFLSYLRSTLSTKGTWCAILVIVSGVRFI